MKILACVASVSVGLGSKERQRNGILPARNWGESQNKNEGVGEGSSLPLNPTETLATQAMKISASEAHILSSFPTSFSRVTLKF